MGRITRHLKSYGGFLLTLLIAMIVLFFVLNYAAQRGVPLAAWAESHANGSAYNAAPAAAAPSVAPLH